MSDFDPAIDAEEEVLTSYTSSTPAASTNRPAIKAPGGGTGRRKEAVARVRLTPGSGKWIVNGKALDVYFPNKVCLLYTSPSPRDRQKSRMPSSA